MRIVLAALHPPGSRKPIGGVQSWCATVGDELRQRGHEVSFWGPGTALTGIYDLGIFANVADTRPAMIMCKKNITVSHGIIAAEKPTIRDAFFTSEEVRDHWHGTGPIVRQPVNLDFWHPKYGEKRLLVRFSYRVGLDFVPGIAKSMGLEYVHVRNSKPIQAQEVLSQAACVLASGRGAVEAMACGVPVVICDDRTYQAALLDPDTLGSMCRNYSGRGGISPTVENVTQAIEEAIANGSLRDHVVQHHDVFNIVDQLLEAA